MHRALPFGVPLSSPRCVRIVMIVADIIREQTTQVTLTQSDHVI
jgi:hypothetical protein